MKLVILAGGSGTRLWPISTKAQPKQIAKLFGDLTLIEKTYERLLDIVSPNDIYIATNSQLTKKISEIIKIPRKNFLIEPAKRDTAPAIAFSVARLLKFSDETIGFLPSDHYIRNEDEFKKAILLADKTVQKHKKLVNFGITPTEPNTSYGYLEVGERLNNPQVYEFIRQVEKPDKDKAKLFVKKGLLWNGGYLFWTPQNFLQAFDKYLGIGERIKELSEITQKDKVSHLYETLPKTSLDYAILEKFKPGDGLTIKTNFGWADLGSWESFYNEQEKHDSKGNIFQADWHGFDTSDCLIYAPRKKIVATLGIKDLVIVDTKEALLIIPKNRSTEIKSIIELLKEHGKEDYL